MNEPLCVHCKHARVLHRPAFCLGRNHRCRCKKYESKWEGDAP